MVNVFSSFAKVKKKMPKSKKFIVSKQVAENVPLNRFAFQCKFSTCPHKYC